jgi:hypothetical protein
MGGEDGGPAQTSINYLQKFSKICRLKKMNNFASIRDYFDKNDEKSMLFQCSKLI